MAEGQIRQYQVGGMKCMGCVSAVSSIAQSFEGVAEVRVDLQSARATIHWSGAADDAKLIESLTAIKRAGASMILTYFAAHAARWLADDVSR